MNVGQLLRSLLNEAQPGDPKTLELKVGQIVKGLVLQILSEHDALLNISGVQVTAHLETPLKQGEVAMLQVQPDNGSGQIILKPMANSTVPIADESLADVLNNMGLKDTAVNRQIVQTLHQENISLSKENLQAFGKVLSAIPLNVKPEQWQQAVLLAVRNNLPITMESVSALHQVVYGAPIKQQLEQLSQQLNLASANPALSQQVSEAITQLKVVLTNLQTISGQAFQTTDVNGESNGKSTMGTNPAAALLAQTDKAGNPLPATSNLLSSSTSKEAASTANHQLTQSSSTIPQTEAPAAKELTTQTGLTKAEASAGPNETVKLPLPSPLLAASTSQTTALNETAALKTQASQLDTPEWIGKWLKSLGIEHEQQLFKALDKAPPTLDKFVHSSQGSTHESVDFTVDVNRPQQEAVKQIVTDSLKSALLQLNAMDDTPPALKESAQQLLQQITGQQLLLSPDRTSMFSHITLMIPMINEQGQQTAAVHIQSRKGSKGEIDATNCRLVFDLQMKSIGNTLVDVQIYNKIVSLNVHNDHDFVANLLETSREEIAASLQNVGYQFLSLKCSHFPQVTSETDSILKEAMHNPTAASYASKPYKGVDLRV